MQVIRMIIDFFLNLTLIRQLGQPSGLFGYLYLNDFSKFSINN